MINTFVLQSAYSVHCRYNSPPAQAFLFQGPILKAFVSVVPQSASFLYVLYPKNLKI